MATSRTSSMFRPWTCPGRRSSKPMSLPGSERGSGCQWPVVRDCVHLRSHPFLPDQNPRLRRPPPRGRGPAGGPDHRDQTPPPPEMHGRIEEGPLDPHVRHPEGSLEDRGGEGTAAQHGDQRGHADHARVHRGADGCLDPKRASTRSPTDGLCRGGFARAQDATHRHAVGRPESRRRNRR